MYKIYDPSGEIRKEYAWTEKYPVFGSTLRDVKRSIEEKIGHQINDPGLKELEEKLKNGKLIFSNLIEYRNQSPNIIRTVAQIRVQRMSLIESLRTDRRNRFVNIYVNNQVAGGVLGSAKMIADGIVSASPSTRIKIYVFGNTFPDGINFNNDDRISIIRVTSQDEIDMKANIHIGVSYDLYYNSHIPFKKGDVFISVNPPANIRGKKVTM